MSKKSLIKVLLSVAMLCVVLYSVDLKTLAEELKAIPASTVVVLVLGYMASQILSALRWWIVVRGAGIQASIWNAISASFVGMYLNCFGVGTLGGDFARGMLITSDSKERQTSLATVIADRSFGLAVLALIGITSSLFFVSAKSDLNLVVAAGVVVALVSAGWFLGPRIMLRIFRQTRWNNLVERLMKGFPHDPKVILALFIVATCFHLFQIELFGFLAGAVGQSIPWSFLLVSIPFANIVSTLPLSWMGLGLRENVYVFFFVPQFLTHEQAVLCGALWLFAMTATSAVGGILAVVSGDLKLLRRRSADLEREDGAPVLGA